MKPFINQIFIQFKMDLRDKDVIVIYYLVPLAFYLIMGVILKSLSQVMDIPFILSTTTFAITMTAFLGLSTVLVKTKEKGIYKAYKVAGIPALSSLLIQVILTIIHMMIISIVILITAPMIFDAKLPSNLLLHFLGILVIGLTSSAIGTLLSSLVKTQSSMTMYGQILFLPSIMFTGMMFPSEFLPKTLRLLGNIFPAALGFKMLKYDTFHFLPFVFLILMGGVAFVVSILMYKRMIKQD